jgi:hypothetical protein
MRWPRGKHNQTRASVEGPRLARSDDLVIEALEDELLVYDRTNKRAHCLSADAARVWQACNGKRDATALSAELGLPQAVVRQALDELEASELLDPRFELVNVVPDNGNGKVVTRRELAVRSAKVGTAVATAPLILSITAPTAMAAITPTFSQCAVSSGNSCGNVAGQCGFIAGCCCCCNWVSGGSCHLCTPVSVCPTSGNCPNPFPINGTGARSNCQSASTGTNPPPLGGCCEFPGNGNCGCVFTPTGNVATTGAGLANGGAGCCIPGTTSGSGTACAQGATGCVPCCNGDPIPASGATPGCCTPAATGSTLCGIP